MGRVYQNIVLGLRAHNKKVFYQQEVACSDIVGVCALTGASSTDHSDAEPRRAQLGEAQEVDRARAPSDALPIAVRRR